jgi:serine/threonine-protein kinase PpkA
MINLSLKISIFSILLICMQSPAVQAAEPDRTPLLMDGKKTLYQRVLTRPDAHVYTELGDKTGKLKPTFTRYYVYQRKKFANKEWLKVGPDSRGKTIGWILADATVPWKQQITLAFTHPAGRERVLFFKERKDLEAILAADSPAKQIEPIRKKVVSGGKDPRVLSIEPEKPVDINKNFYLLPILQAEEVYSGTTSVNMLEIASVSQTQQDGQKKADEKQQSEDNSLLLHRFKAAVVFVIDSTISMGPYIDRTRDAVKRIYKQIEKAELLDKIKFGLVAYRSSTDAVPKLQYTAKQYVDPVTVKDGKDFLAKVENLKPAEVSSSLFDEDAYAGIMKALNKVKWSDFGARYIVLITDAGAIQGDNELSSTGLGAEEVNREAKFRGVAIYSLHLKTPQGEKNHQHAAAQYKVLSSTPLLQRSLYYPINMGSVDEFSNIVDSLASSVVKLVNDAYQGKSVAGSAKTADVDFGATKTDQQLSTADKISQDAALMGYAMQLTYLGSETGTKAPPLFKAWISDSAIENPRKKSTEVRVLLTKNQLSDMYQVVKSIVDAVLEGMISPDSFFAQLRSAAATLGRDPNQINQEKNVKLAELGLMGEYLDDLPYHSYILDIDEETWLSYGPHQQDAMLKDLKRKLNHYQVYNDDSDRWLPLAENSDPADYVYPVPIEMLP